LYDFVGIGQPEGTEHKPGLVHVIVVLIDDVDAEIGLVVGLANAVRRERAIVAAPRMTSRFG